MSPSKINREWHEANLMPKNPTKAQRLEWHIDHARNCTCRMPTPKLQAEIDDYQRAKTAPAAPSGQ